MNYPTGHFPRNDRVPIERWNRCTGYHLGLVPIGRSNSTGLQRTPAWQSKRLRCSTARSHPGWDRWQRGGPAKLPVHGRPASTGQLALSCHAIHQPCSDASKAGDSDSDHCRANRRKSLAMPLRDCYCGNCLSYRATRDKSGMCAARQSGRHPGDPRPAGRFVRAIDR